MVLMIGGTVGVGGLVTVADDVAVCVAVGVGDGVAVALAVGVAVGVGDGVAVAVGVLVAVGAGVSVAVAVSVAVGVSVGVSSGHDCSIDCPSNEAAVLIVDVPTVPMIYDAAARPVTSTFFQTSQESKYALDRY